MDSIKCYSYRCIEANKLIKHQEVHQEEVIAVQGTSIKPKKVKVCVWCTYTAPSSQVQRLMNIELPSCFTSMGQRIGSFLTKKRKLCQFFYVYRVRAIAMRPIALRSFTLLILMLIFVDLFIN